MILLANHKQEAEEWYVMWLDLWLFLSLSLSISFLLFLIDKLYTLADACVCIHCPIIGVNKPPLPLEKEEKEGKVAALLAVEA